MSWDVVSAPPVTVRPVPTSAPEKVPVTPVLTVAPCPATKPESTVLAPLRLAVVVPS